MENTNYIGMIFHALATRDPHELLQEKLFNNKHTPQGRVVALLSGDLPLTSKKLMRIVEDLSHLIPYAWDGTDLSDTFKDDIATLYDRLKAMASLIEESEGQSSALLKKIDGLRKSFLIASWDNNLEAFSNEFKPTDSINSNPSFSSEEFIDNQMYISQARLDELNADQLKKMLEEHEVDQVHIQGKTLQPLPADYLKRVIELKRPLSKAIDLFYRDLSYSQKNNLGEEVSITLDPRIANESGYFRALLDGNWITKTENIPLENISPEQMEMVNYFLSDPTSFTIDNENIEDLLRAADFLEIPALVKACDNFLSKQLPSSYLFEENLSEDDVTTLFVMHGWSNDYRLTELRQRVEARLSLWINFGCHKGMEEGENRLRKLKDHHIEMHKYTLDYLNTDRGTWLDIIHNYQPSLKELELNYIDTDGMSISPCLEKMTHLQKLCMNYCSMKDGIGLSQAQMQNLTDLTLSYCNLTDNIIPFLEQMTNLKALNIGGNLCLSNMGSALNNMKNLRKLDICGAAVQDDIGPILEQMSDLEELNLYACKSLTDNMGFSFAKMTNLKNLNIGHSSLTGNIVKYLENIKNLTRLHLSGFDLSTEETDASLSKMTNLKELYLDDCTLKDNFGIYLEKLTNLELLNMSDLKNRIDIGPSLAQLQRLKYLVIDEKFEIKELAPYLYYLKKLTINTGDSYPIPKTREGVALDEYLKSFK